MNKFFYACDLFQSKCVNARFATVVAVRRRFLTFKPSLLLIPLQPWNGEDICSRPSSFSNSSKSPIDNKSNDESECKRPSAKNSFVDRNTDPEITTTYSETISRDSAESLPQTCTEFVPSSSAMSSHTLPSSSTSPNRKPDHVVSLSESLDVSLTNCIYNRIVIMICISL